MTTTACGLEFEYCDGIYTVTNLDVEATIQLDADGDFVATLFDDIVNFADTFGAAASSLSRAIHSFLLQESYEALEQAKLLRSGTEEDEDPWEDEEDDKEEEENFDFFEITSESSKEEIREFLNEIFTVLRSY
jgi:hypothetical protein